VSNYLHLKKVQRTIKHIDTTPTINSGLQSTDPQLTEHITTQLLHQKLKNETSKKV